MENFEPKIVGFLCNWCSYGGADVAGQAKLPVPSSFFAIRVMCSSRVSSQIILTAYLRGADGILIAGCHPGDCHYEKGNYYTRRRFVHVKNILNTLGLEPERLRLSWISASEGQRFSGVVNEFTNHIREMGPNPAKENKNL